MDSAVGLMRTGQRGVILYSLAKAPDKARQSDELFRTEANKIHALLNEFRPLVATESGRKAIAEIQDDLDAWKPVFEELTRRCASQHFDAATFALLARGATHGREMTDATGKLLEIQRKFMAASSEEAVALYGRSRWMTILILVVAVCVGIIGLIVVRSTNRILQLAARELSQASQQVAGAAGQISSSSRALAQGASEQAASLEETSASSEEISAMTRKNADDARMAADLMNDTSQVVNAANSTLLQMESSMEEINGSSEKIGKIIKVIDEIAFQTNILVLNAAVEAARAGRPALASLSSPMKSGTWRNARHRPQKIRLA